jgi:hypothetical protein
MIRSSPFVYDGGASLGLLEHNEQLSMEFRLRFCTHDDELGRETKRVGVANFAGKHPTRSIAQPGGLKPGIPSCVGVNV